jgi:hypothetical protein
MPKIRAREAMLIVRSDLPHRMMTGYITAQDQERASEIGIRAVVLRPDSVDDLGRVADGILRDESAPSMLNSTAESKLRCMQSVRRLY